MLLDETQDVILGDASTHAGAGHRFQANAVLAGDATYQR
jgi:hypothetical protein